MLILPLLFLLMNALPTRLAPAGTQVHIRLTTTIGSYASGEGTPVSAVLIAPVIVDGETVMPAGSVVSGNSTSWLFRAAIPSPLGREWRK